MFGMKILDPVAIKEVVENGVEMPIIITNLEEPQKTTSIERTLAAVSPLLLLLILTPPLRLTYPNTKKRRIPSRW